MKSVWQTVKSSVKERIPAHCYKMWIEPLQIESIDNDTVHLACPNHFSKKRLEHHYEDLIRSEFEAVAGKPQTLQFDVKPLAKAKKDAPQGKSGFQRGHHSIKKAKVVKRLPKRVRPETPGIIQSQQDKIQDWPETAAERKRRELSEKASETQETKSGMWNFSIPLPENLICTDDDELKACDFDPSSMKISELKGMKRNYLKKKGTFIPDREDWSEREKFLISWFKRKTGDRAWPDHSIKIRPWLTIDSTYYEKMMQEIDEGPRSKYCLYGRLQCNLETLFCYFELHKQDAPLRDKARNEYLGFS